MTAGRTFSLPSASARRRIGIEREAHGFLLSLLLHGSVAAVVLLEACLSYERPKVAHPVIELVPGPRMYDGTAETAPPGVTGIKVTLPKPSPHPVAPIESEKENPPSASSNFTGPVQPAAPIKPRPKPATPRPVTHPRPGTNQIAHLNPEEIRAGLIGGVSNQPNGSGPGTALTAEQRDLLQEYQSLLAAKIRLELNDRPGVGAGLTVEIELHVLSDGSITRVRIVKSSGSPGFDELVQETLRKLSLPPRPPGFAEHQRFPIRGIEAK